MIGGSILLVERLRDRFNDWTWKGFIVARSQYKRLMKMLQRIPAESEKMSLPAPEGSFR